MNKKGQGALEYLLLIGGAILVAVVVITILSGVGGSGGKQTEINAVQALCTSRPQASCPGSATVGNTTCTCVFDTVTSACKVDPANASDDCP